MEINMRIRFLFLPIVVLLATYCFPQGVVLPALGMPVAAPVTPTYVYVYPASSGAGSDVFTQNYGSATSGFLLSQLIPLYPSYGGTQTQQLGFKFFSVGTATQCWLALYSGAGTLIESGGTFTPTTGWNNATITPYTFAEGESDYVTVACNGTFTINDSTTVLGSVGKYQGPYTYTSTPPSAITYTNDTLTYAARVGIQ